MRVDRFCHDPRIFVRYQMCPRGFRFVHVKPVAAAVWCVHEGMVGEFDVARVRHTHPEERIRAGRFVLVHYC
jgi:hypothetical protein